MRPDLGQVCHLVDGGRRTARRGRRSARRQGDFVPRGLGLDGFGDFALVRQVRFQLPSSRTALKKRLGMRTECWNSDR